MKIKRRHITLIEIMIVMFLIALITGAIAYNYRGSLDEGKAFKTKAGIERLTTILNLKAAESPAFAENVGGWREVVRASPLVQNPNTLIKDGWGEDYRVDLENGVIKVHSEKYESYKKTHSTMFSDEGERQ